MKYDQYVSLIKSLEAYARTNRRSYEYRVMGLAALGYAYFLGLVLLALIIPAIFIVGLISVPQQLLRILLLAAKLWWILVPALGAFFGFVGGAIKAIFSTVPAPTGRVLERAEAPGLFQFVSATCASLNAKPPEQILVTDDFNAAVVTLPRIGLFGRKVYLLVGLPLMHALSAEQFKAVLAHEIGHISEKHGSFAKWAYQLHEAWGRLIDSQEAHDHKFAALYQKFVAWFFPYFTAYSFVLMREHEKDADRHAVQLTGARALGDALVTLQTRGADVEDVFWKKVHEENVAGGEPPKELFSKMLESLATVDPNRDLVTLEKALKVPTDYHDTHPSLAERLQLMGHWNGSEPPRLPPKVEVSAADYFLGEEVKKHVHEFNQDWDEKVQKGWQSRFEDFQKGDKRIAELDAKAADGQLSVEEMIERAGLVAGKEGNAAALPLMREIVSQHPENAEANYILGGVLLSNDDEEGLQYVHKAIDLDHKWAYAGSSVAFQYLRSKGRLEEAKRYAVAMEEQQDVIVKAEAERKWVYPTDQLEAHSLGTEDVEAIVSKMQYYDEIQRIYLARKKVEHFKEIPFHVLCFELKKPKRFGGEPQLNSQELLKIAAERLAGIDIGFFLTLDGSFDAMKSALQQLPGAKIFERAE